MTCEDALGMISGNQTFKPARRLESKTQSKPLFLLLASGVSFLPEPGRYENERVAVDVCLFLS